jgi:Fe-S oxidoreductase
MSEQPAGGMSYEERLRNLTEAERAQAIATFRSKIDAAASAYLNACVHCGLCADSCHYYLASGEAKSVPAYKLGLVQGLFEEQYSMLGKLLPFLKGAQPFDSRAAEEWVDVLYGRCTMCGRCTLNCTVGINIHGLIRAARTTLASIDLVPPELQATVDAAVQSGNNMAIPTEEWRETVQWLEEELQQDLNDPSARLPLDCQGARILYAINPREAKFFPLSLVAAAKIFHVARESWTMASDYYDVTNYGLFSGNDQEADLISGRLREAAKRLGCSVIVLGECGHGFAANRWNGPEWRGEAETLRVVSILEVIASYVREGRIRLDASRATKRATLHDPCNLVRMGGMIEEQRFILRQAVTDFVEMTPNREQNYCCGGGGGQLSMTRFAKRRIEAGRIKADQIKATGAKVLVAPCHNCIDQLGELNKEYKLGVAVRTMSEMVADALILPEKSRS